MPPRHLAATRNLVSFRLASSSSVRLYSVIYTEAFQWKTQPDTLCEFFWRLNFLSPVDRGYDTTVTPVMDDDEEAKVALSKLRAYEGWEDREKLKVTNLYRFLVRDDRATDGQLRSYITPGAIWDTDELFGRCTFGYIAYDVATPKLVYLKDFWRTDLPRIQNEGDVYRKLHDVEVSNIPTVHWVQRGMFLYHWAMQVYVHGPIPGSPCS